MMLNHIRANYSFKYWPVQTFTVWNGCSFTKYLEFVVTSFNINIFFLINWTFNKTEFCCWDNLYKK